MENRSNNIVLKFIVCLIIIMFIILNLFINVEYSYAYKNGSALQVGDYIKYGKYYGDDILWRVIHIVTSEDVQNNSYKDYQEGDVLLLSHKILCLKSFDAKDSSQSDSNRKKYGCNNWKDSTIKIWLNSEKVNMNANDYNEPDSVNSAPTSGNVWDGKNEYDKEAGFLSTQNFKKGEIAFIRSVKNRFVIDKNKDIPEGNSGNEHDYETDPPDDVVNDYDTAAYQTSVDKVFLLNIKEAAYYLDNKLKYLQSEGNISSGKDYHLAIPTKKAVDKSEYKFSGYLSKDDTWFYWLRDADTEHSYTSRTINKEGEVSGYSFLNHYKCYSGARGIRPALYLNVADMYITDNTGGSPSECYKLYDATKPTGTFTPNSSNLINYDINIKFKPYDNLSGVKRWKYKISTDSGETYNNYSSYFTGGDEKTLNLSQNGNIKIMVKIEDNQGNINHIESGVYKIDKIPPNDANIVISPQYLTNQDISVIIQYSDDSINKQYKINNGSWQNYSEGIMIQENCTIYARSKDEAENISNVVSCDIDNIDKTIPGLAEIIVDPTYMTNQNVSVNINYPSDVSVKEYKIGNGSWETYTGEIVIEQNSVIFARGYDLAGNCSLEKSMNIVNIDKIKPNKPIINISYLELTKENITANVVYPEDAYSKEYKIGNGSWVLYENDLIIDSNCRLSVRSIDEAGNMSEVETYEILNIDKTPPAIPYICLTPEFLTGKDIEVRIDYSIDSEVKEYKINDGEWIYYNNKFSVKENCVIYARCSDLVGNNSESNKEISNIDPILKTLKDKDKKNFRYFLGKDYRGMTRAYLASKTGKNNLFELEDIMFIVGENKNKFKNGFIYIDREGNYRKYIDLGM